MIVVLCDSMKDARSLYNEMINLLRRKEVDTSHILLHPYALCVEYPQMRERFLFTDYRMKEYIDPEGTNLYYKFVDEFSFIENMCLVASEYDIMELLREDVYY